MCQKSKWNYKEFSFFPNICIFNFMCSKDHMKYFTYIIQFSPHPTHTHEEPASPRGLATCLTSQSLEAGPRFELRPICLQFNRCLLSTSCCTSSSLSHTAFPPMPFGVRDTAKATFSGYRLGSPLKYDRGWFFDQLIRKSQRSHSLV